MRVLVRDRYFERALNADRALAAIIDGTAGGDVVGPVPTVRTQPYSQFFQRKNIYGPIAEQAISAIARG